VTKNQVFLSGFPTRVCGSKCRRLQDVIAARRRDLNNSSIATNARRWNIELRLRDVKTTLQMDHLRVKTPETARMTHAP